MVANGAQPDSVYPSYVLGTSGLAMGNYSMMGEVREEEGAMVPGAAPASPQRRDDENDL